MELTHFTNNSKKIICSLGLFIISLPVGAAGFDCAAKNLNTTEAAICQDSYLSGMDNALNKFFNSALENSVNHGTLYRQQRQWVKERNQCGDNVACIKRAYIDRNKALTEVLPYLSVDEAFVRDGDLLDPPMAQDLQNKDGFTVTEDRWRVKLIVPEWVISSAKFHLEGANWQVLTHRVVNGDLVIYFLVSGQLRDQQINYVVRVENGLHLQIVARHAFPYSDDVFIQYQPEGNGSIVYSVFHRPDPELGDSDDGADYAVETYSVDASSNTVSLTDSKTRSEAGINKETWVGYCGTQECFSRVASPDRKWRLASRDGTKGEKDEGMFYFPVDKPDQGINVFLTQADTSTDNGFGYMRNYVWGDENTFYFDNEGAYACIWKADIKNKVTQRILPIEGMQQPYYLNYNNEDMVIASYRYYSEKNKMHHYEIYIAKK
ncbi:MULTISPECIES: lysozyme inhibitor LprI family protein [Klebsiella]|uniref:lysozyme inhibitor LprI family protein n=1 Tax=Klebsiella TaxID=570 RepID=UPI000A7E7036|nr:MULTISPECIES: hypothetical protein [Klebsiella]MDX6054280.1 hypothetical protein [Klebsiella sp. JN_Kp126]MEB8077699.1 hypothetical protein [Klebsiella michiganensis]